tara:strand:- start:3145 stop:3579 length:435 start_codon:yes stop_codon:yes gene_type:complete
MGNFLKNNIVNPFAKGSTTGATQIATGVSAERPGGPLEGQMRLNTTSDFMEYYNDGGWINIAKAGFATITKTTVVFGDGSTTVFNGFFGSAPPDENSVIVVVGNVIQEPDQAYTISGTNITFTSAPPNTHRIYALTGFDSTSAP